MNYDQKNPNPLVHLLCFLYCLKLAQTQCGAGGQEEHGAVTRNFGDQEELL